MGLPIVIVSQLMMYNLTHVFDGLTGDCVRAVRAFALEDCSLAIVPVDLDGCIIIVVCGITFVLDRPALVDLIFSCYSPAASVAPIPAIARRRLLVGIRLVGLIYEV